MTFAHPELAGMGRFVYILLFLVLASCGTKKKTVRRDHIDTTEVVRDSSVYDSLVHDALIRQQRQLKEEVMRTIASQLSLAYDGQSGDSLIMQLKDDIDGLSLLVTGTGKATYERSEEMNWKQVRDEIYHRLDSLHSVKMNRLQQLDRAYRHWSVVKEKEVKRKWPWWLIAMVTAVVSVVICQAFKRFTNTV